MKHMLLALTLLTSTIGAVQAAEDVPETLKGIQAAAIVLASVFGRSSEPIVIDPETKIAHIKPPRKPIVLSSAVSNDMVVVIARKRRG